MASPNSNFSKSDTVVLREIARRNNLIAQTGPHAGGGSTRQLKDKMVAGETLVVVLDNEERQLLMSMLNFAAEYRGEQPEWELAAKIATMLERSSDEQSTSAE